MSVNTLKVEIWVKKLASKLRWPVHTNSTCFFIDLIEDTLNTLKITLSVGWIVHTRLLN